MVVMAAIGNLYNVFVLSYFFKDICIVVFENIVSPSRTKGYKFTAHLRDLGSPQLRLLL